MAEKWPESLEPESMDWGLVSNDRVHTSPLSNSQQVIEMPGSYWRCTVRFGNLSCGRDRELSALIGRMRGRAGTVLVPRWQRERSDDVGSPSVVSALVYSYVIEAAGFTPSTDVFAAGDYMSINGELFEVVDNVQSSASGAASIPVNKRVRATIAPGEPIEYREPVCRMRRVDPRFSMSVRSTFSSTSIELREAF